MSEAEGATFCAKTDFRSLMRLAGCLKAGAMRDAHTFFVSILVTRTWLKQTDYHNLQRQSLSLCMMQP